jgi:DNA-binding transcriptional LysR family regulator
MLVPPDKLARLDLNLLVALQVLLEECNVTRAAERLFITQPAMSRTLSRLRDLFDDPLFTRAARGLIPTPRAEELALRLPALLDSVGHLVTPPGFDPASHQCHFRIAVVEQFGQSLFGPLAAELSQQAPGIVIQALDYHEGISESLAKGNIDFVIDEERLEDADIDFLPLLASSPTLIARKGHPLARKGKLQLGDALKHRFVRCFPIDTVKAIPIFDQLLAKHGLERQCFFQTSNLLTALQVVHSSDGLIACPEFVLNSPLLEHDFTVLGLPAELEGTDTIIGLAQHKRTLSSPAHQWLTQKIADITAEHWQVKR